jgi:hypothetical protein
MQRFLPKMFYIGRAWIQSSLFETHTNKNTKRMVHTKCKIFLFLSFIAFFSLQSCVEELDIERESVSSVTPKEIVKSSIYGKVIDENNQAIPNAQVTLQTAEGSKSSETNSYGQFEFFNVRVKASSAFLKVSVPGKFEGFRRVDVVKNAVNYTEIKMLDRQIAGSIDAGSGGAVSTLSGAQVRLPANAVVTQSGQAYTGPISVAMQWIDPTAEDLYQRLVGDLSGIDIEGNEVVLGTFGMMNVELLDNQGNELQLADDARAELTWPVPSERLSDAPQNIPVWSYDEGLGTWIEEEMATQNGNTFVGEVSHFSSWNLDWKGPTVTLNGRVTYNGNPGDILSAFRVDVSSPLFGSRGGFLTTDGEFQFLRFPADEVFDLTIKNLCGETVYEETYGPFSQDTDLGVIDILNSAIDKTSVIGVAVDCDNNPIEGAIVQIVTNSNKYYIEETGSDGLFEFTVPYCGSSTTAEVSIVDPGPGLVSSPQTITISSTAEFDLGNVRVCDQAAIFFQLSVDTLDLFYTPPQGFPFFFKTNPSTAGSELGLEGNESYVQILSDEVISDIGSYTSSFHYFSLGRGNDRVNYTNNFPADLNLDITEYSDTPGEFIGGSFMGSVSRDSTGLGTPVDISGAFRIEVQQ